MRRIDAGRYEILVGEGLLDRLADLMAQSGLPNVSAAAIISDSNVAPLYAERVRTALHSLAIRSELFVVPAAEESKSRREWALISDAMIARGLGRDSIVISLGGGVIGDLAGFVAATFARGIPIVQVPTSLLAMVDASIGGKTAVDTPGGKNLIGAFHWPTLVVVDPIFLATLPLEEWRAGFAEVIKHGAIASEAHFNEAASLAAQIPHLQGDTLTDLIAESVRIKATIVASDERECGPRRALNAGHTVAHAIEHVSRFAVPHGAAVAIGLVIESTLGERLGITAKGTADAIRAALQRADLPTTVPSNLSHADLIAATHSDKKARRAAVEYVFLTRIGTIDIAGGRYSRPVADADVAHVLATPA